MITESNVPGHLCIKKPWPGMARTIYGNHESFMDIYYRQHAGTAHSYMYLTVHRTCVDCLPKLYGCVSCLSPRPEEVRCKDQY